MSCIDKFAESNPCIYKATCGVTGTIAVIAVAIATITLLANYHIIDFTAFHLDKAWSLGIGIPGALILAGLCVLAIRSCCKKEEGNPDSLVKLSGEPPPGNTTTTTSAAAGERTPIITKPKPKPGQPDRPNPNTLLNPDGKPTPPGAPGGGPLGGAINIKPRPRAKSLS